MLPNLAPFSLAEILEATGGVLKTSENRPIIGVTTDSRTVESANLFVALRGERFDGHDFIENARKIGALTLGETQNADIMVPNSLEALGNLAKFHRARFVIPVIAITGSYGKTTTRALVQAALKTSLETLSSEGNFNNEIGVPMTLLGLNADFEVAVVEMGMRGRGQIAYLSQIARPTVAVITNIGPQHIELLGSIEEIAAAKAEVLQSLPADALAVLPADSDWLELLKSHANCRIITFGISKNADYRAQNIETTPEGTLDFQVFINARPEVNDEKSDFKHENSEIKDEKSQFIDEKSEVMDEKSEFIDELSEVMDEKSQFIHELSEVMDELSEVKLNISDFNDESSVFVVEDESSGFQISLPLPGNHNAINAAAAFAVAHQLGIAPDCIIEGLEGAVVPGARMRVLKVGQNVKIIDDCYNAGPDSTRAALQTLLDFPGFGRKIAVLGAMKELGEFSESEHVQIGRFAGTFCEVLVGVGSETRPLLNAALVAAQEVENPMQVFWHETAADAASGCGDWLEDGDIVLVKGSRSVGLERVVEELKGL